MKRVALSILLLIPLYLYSQRGMMPQDSSGRKQEKKPIGIGIKAGFNFSNVTNASQINAASRTGYHFGIVWAKPTKRIIGSRTEIIYSRHGYNYSDSASKANGSIDLDYIMLSQYMSINITKYVSIMLGGQTGYLLNAKADSGQAMGGYPGGASGLLSFYNRFDYGYGGGIEVHPYSGLLIGALFNISLNNLYKPNFSSYGGGMPSFAPSIDLKNNVIQVFAGWRF